MKKLLSLLRNKTLSLKWYSVPYYKDKGLLFTCSRRENCGTVGDHSFQAFLRFVNKVIQAINMPTLILCVHYDNKELLKIYMIKDGYTYSWGALLRIV